MESKRGGGEVISLASIRPEEDNKLRRESDKVTRYPAVVIPLNYPWRSQPQRNMAAFKAVATQKGLEGLRLPPQHPQATAVVADVSDRGEVRPALMTDQAFIRRSIEQFHQYSLISRRAAPTVDRASYLAFTSEGVPANRQTAFYEREPLSFKREAAQPALESFSAMENRTRSFEVNSLDDFGRVEKQLREWPVSGGVTAANWKRLAIDYVHIPKSRRTTYQADASEDTIFPDFTGDYLDSFFGMESSQGSLCAYYVKDGYSMMPAAAIMHPFEDIAFRGLDRVEDRVGEDRVVTEMALQRSTAFKLFPVPRAATASTAALSSAATADVSAKVTLIGATLPTNSTHETNMLFPDETKDDRISAETALNAPPVPYLPFLVFPEKFPVSTSTRPKAERGTEETKERAANFWDWALERVDFDFTQEKDDSSKWEQLSRVTRSMVYTVGDAALAILTPTTLRSASDYLCGLAAVVGTTAFYAFSYATGSLVPFAIVGTFVAKKFHQLYSGPSKIKGLRLTVSTMDDLSLEGAPPLVHTRCPPVAILQTGLSLPAAERCVPINLLVRPKAKRTEAAVNVWFCQVGIKGPFSLEEVKRLNDELNGYAAFASGPLNAKTVLDAVKAVVAVTGPAMPAREMIYAMVVQYPVNVVVQTGSSYEFPAT